MLKKTLLCCLLIIATLYGVDAQSLSTQSTISLLTGSPGNELYSTFGHSAVRVKDPASNVDMVFNYGTFDFSTPNFYVKFVQGKLLYILSVEPFESFQFSFQYQNRSVTEQVLNLDMMQKNRLYSMLLENYKPENRSYKYDFFFDNCATRIRDILGEALDDKLQYNYPEVWQKGDITFRNLIDLYLLNHPWSDFGIDLALGVPTDHVARPTDYMFLPDYLSMALDSAVVMKGDASVPLVLSKTEILGNVPVDNSSVDVPLILAWSLCILSFAFTYQGIKKRHRRVWFDTIFFSVIGIVGWVVFLLWFATDHIATKTNLNILWAVPLHMPLFLFWNALPTIFRKIYIWFTLILYLAILAFWKIIPQSFHAAFIPLILIMVTRYFIIIQEMWARKPKRAK
jgi:hypothetical protein